MLELPPTTDRLRRLIGLIQRCPFSIHDLSRIQLSKTPFRVPRFNMPFELGLTIAVAHGQPGRLAHQWRVFESVFKRLNQSLSDLDGYDHFVHGGAVRGIAEALCDAFADLPVPPMREPQELHRVYVKLREVRLRELGKSVYTAQAFAKLVFAARSLVVELLAARSIRYPRP